jgi:protein-L-isoaspartate(D-aspartate) O-methyltransferase
MRGWLLSIALWFCVACTPQSAEPETQRARMVEEQIAGRGIRDPRVLDAMRSVPRHEFVPERLRAEAYGDHPLPIGHEQTISQPYIVALMTQELKPKAGDKVLEIGTGSGYQAAVLAKLVKDVYSIEIVEPLGKRAAADLRRLGFANVHTRVGDGYAGWPEEAPFDAIIVTCAPEDVPPALVAQLKEGGRMVIPVGKNEAQTLFVMVKRAGRMEEKQRVPVRFVPMTRGPVRSR